MKWVRRILIGVGVLLVVLVALVAGVLIWFGLPSIASGLTAQTVCGAVFVAGRDTPPAEIVANDVKTQNPLLGVVSVSVDDQQHTATGRFLGLFSRTSALRRGQGCVLDGAPDPGARPGTPAPANPAAWPSGDAPLSASQVAATGVDDAALTSALDTAMAGGDDPNGIVTRGVAVVQRGKLLALRDGVGVTPNTPALGWSMAKTVTGMLAWKKFQEVGLSLQSPVVDAFPAGRAPSWVADWKKDGRARITVADLLYMRSGLDITEGYGPGGDVVQMLYAENNMSGWAARHPLATPPGTSWVYVSASTNIVAAVLRAQFATDQEYFDYARSALFTPIGATSGSMETDQSGNWVGSSYAWASTGDWARLGQVMLHDGTWQGTQVFPKGWLVVATTPAMPTGEGHGYGAFTWLPGAPVGGECARTPGFPKDAMFMEGHYGQVVAMIPSKDAVIVRLGWSVNSEFDDCTFVAAVAKTLAP